MSVHDRIAFGFLGMGGMLFLIGALMAIWGEKDGFRVMGSGAVIVVSGLFYGILVCNE